MSDIKTEINETENYNELTKRGRLSVKYLNQTNKRKKRRGM